MANLSWGEIRSRAAAFAAEWADESYEKGESQSFWTELLAVYGVDRRRAGALFEVPTRRFRGDEGATGGKREEGRGKSSEGTGGAKRGYIDLFWPGKLVVEQKSAGRNLDDAERQAHEYVMAMSDADLPAAIVVCDFQTFRVYDLGTRQTVEFGLAELPRNVRVFGFLVGQDSKYIAEEDPVNRRAAEGMAKLHNRLEAYRYTGRDLEVLLVRLVFCLFADDAQIFERGAFGEYIKRRTNVDGTDLGPRLVRLFDVLNTPVEERQTTLEEELRAFPYVNGGLFADSMRIPDFSAPMRWDLLEACNVNWSKVSPAIFGSMFQGVMDERERHDLGAHYTSERNILRVIKPLFLDDLYEEFERVRENRRQLDAFHAKLAGLNFLDPACGCGNFLVITYRELRRLEHKVVQVKQRGQTALDLRDLLRVNVDQMHGIELEEFPALVAQTALWLTDHQMNLEASAMLGQTYTRLPLTTSANVVRGNALTLDWADIVPPKRLSFILGNPPFNGSRTMSAGQKAELRAVAAGIREAGFLDFVTGWYLKAVRYIAANPTIRVAFVSTNSITQGEQVGILWDELLAKGAKIHFGHRTFKWSNEGRGVAAVYCVIVGFGLEDDTTKVIYDYPDIRGEPVPILSGHINPYLADAPDVLVRTRQRPLCDVPEIIYGNMPADGGQLVLKPAEAADLLQREPNAAPYVKSYIGAEEFLPAKERYCLWLVGIEPSVLRSLPLVYAHVERNRQVREKSSRPQLAARPALFAQITQPTSRYLFIPRVTSENREYIPMAFFGADTILSDLAFAMEGATLYHFGVLTSRMHMAWVRAVCGRLESRYRYSKDIVYNNFPWPAVTEGQRRQVERLAQAVLDARELFSSSTLADLYDPISMPPTLTKSHSNLDRAVDRLYRAEAFASDLARVELLFEEYGRLTESVSGNK